MRYFRESGLLLDLIRQQRPSDFHDILSRSAIGPELGAIVDVVEPPRPADGGNMVFHFTELSPAAVDAAGLCRVAEIFRFSPGHIGIFARRIDEEIPYDKRMPVASWINVTDASRGNGRANSDLMFAGSPHLEAHQASADREFVGRGINQTKVNSRLGLGIGCNKQLTLMRHLRETPKANQGNAVWILVEDFQGCK